MFRDVISDPGGESDAAFQARQAAESQRAFSWLGEFVGLELWGQNYQ